MKCVLTTACMLVAAYAAGESKQVPTYTNSDLERVSKFRAQTGVTTEARSENRPSPERASEQAERERWRREVERLERRNEPLLDRIYKLKQKIEARRDLPGVSLYFDPSIEAWEMEIERLQLRIRTREERLFERARRARIPPGWLR